MAPCHERLILGATLMNTLASAACALLLIGSGVSAQTLDDLKKDGNGGSTDNILTYGMGYHQQRYSPLKQINKQTVKRLVPVWSISLANEVGEQGQRSEEHTSELQSRQYLVCRLLLEKKKIN